MSTFEESPSVVPIASLRSFFHRALHQAAESQKVKADDTVIFYLTHLLSDYARSERLYDHTEDGVVRRPLAELYRLASEAASSRERNLLLQRLGDVALFVAGILPNSLRRSLVDVDYYVTMGSSAYGLLSDASHAELRLQALRSVFAQLSSRFVQFVDLLAETVEPGTEARCPDLMRLHDLWVKTGSRRIERQLIAWGITPHRAGGLH